MGNKEYIRGFTDALELVLLELKRAKDLDELRRRVELMLGLALEHKLEELARQLGYPLRIG